ncbi:ankyrin repeat domain-containing protein [Dyadobacter luticola]|uniref:Ankyrin repeat domain-containing protein n=1 Tax=Dyadobacter luticola TaxID=1979387 RepID=A0A5R9L190_9BACT|nr:ankyrin repeat domain-containing protein [Dyadobacter luticola]TLV02293.1 ankyrin repeat domain-containing protein [Dyadobacter luticola]
MNTTDVLPLIETPTLDYYESKACELFESCKTVSNYTIQHIRKYHPDPDKLADVNRLLQNFSLDDARLILAREHGFSDLETFISHICELAREGSQVQKFERAVDAIVRGDAETLEFLIASDPRIVRSRSSRAHEATLLHYVAANGLEIYRQETPANIVEIAELLLSKGCEVDALAKVFDNRLATTLELTVSSGHSAAAGVQSALVEKLLDHGAKVNGVLDDSSPLVTALYHRHAGAAETLAARGARIDNVVTAAAMGRREILAQYLDENGKVTADAPILNVGWLPRMKTPQENLELGFVWAAMLNRVDTVSYLLDNHINLLSRDHKQWTALHWAAYLGHLEIVDLLLKRRAPLEARHEIGGTVLDQTLWATINRGVSPDHVEIIRKLIEAGAKIHSWWHFATLTPPLDDRIADLLMEFDNS